MMVQEANWIMVLGGSVEFESGSQEDETTSSLAVGPQAEARAQIEANATEEDDEVTPDDTMVHKSGKRKRIDGESDDELSTDMSKEERRQHKKACMASRKEAREKEELEQQQRDAVFVGAFGSRVPVSMGGSQPDTALVSESAPVDNCANADPTTGA
uniref:Uncharacterized protein n=1 Tax=Solanum tuberosum TaxID=4113 RepID=M1DBR3_SOLTU